MLYKVGGLLYTDRSRQAIRKCMEPLVSPSKRSKTTSANAQLNRTLAARKMTDFLQLVKNNYQKPPVRLSLFDDDPPAAVAADENGVLSTTSVKRENVSELRNALKLKATEEMTRMKSVLANSCKLLGSLATDENAAQKLFISRRLKRKADRGKFVVVGGMKKIKEESITDENYDLNSLLSFNKTKASNNAASHFQTISSAGLADGYSMQDLNEMSQQQRADTMDNVSYNVYLNQENGNVYVGNETEQLLQTFKDLETEIRKTVGSNMQELYVTTTQPQPMANNDTNTLYSNYAMNTSANMEFKENCETLDSNITNLEETISKDYSLFEEYCKNIANDELFLEGK